MNDDLAEHNGRTGVWLKTEHAEAFVGLDPPRLWVFRAPGGPNLLDDVGAYGGVRVWVMEPTQNADAGKPADQTATVQARSPRSVTVAAPPAPDADLAASLTVALADDKPSAVVTHTLRNHSEHARYLAPWAILTTPWSADSDDRTQVVLADVSPVTAQARHITYLLDTDPSSPQFAYGPRSVTITPDPPDAGPSESHLKIGVASAAGLGAFLQGDHALLTFAPYEPEGLYPEGGPNLTSYVSRPSPDHAWAEVEHVAPLRVVLPGQAATLTHTLLLTSRTDALQQIEDAAETFGPTSP